MSEDSGDSDDETIFLGTELERANMAAFQAVVRDLLIPDIASVVFAYWDSQMYPHISWSPDCQWPLRCMPCRQLEVDSRDAWLKRGREKQLKAILEPRKPQGDV